MTPCSAAFGSIASSDQCDTAALRAAYATLPLAHLDAQHFGDDGDSARDLLLVEPGKSETQGVRKRRIGVKVATRSEEHTTLLSVNQQFVGIEAERQLEPQTHSAFRAFPTASFRHVLAQRFVDREEARGIDFAHLGKVLSEQAPA